MPQYWKVTTVTAEEVPRNVVRCPFHFKRPFQEFPVPRFTQPQLDAADAVIALAKSVSGGELTIDELAKVIIEKVHPICFQSLKVSLVNSLLAVEKVCSDFEEQQDRKRRNSHA